MPHDNAGAWRWQAREFARAGTEGLIWLAANLSNSNIQRMKWILACAAVCLLGAAPLEASTIMVVPVFEPLSLRGTDGDDALADIGEALQATVIARPMALTGAFPEDLITAIRTSHQIPTNNPNYQVKEANLLVLCDVGISAEMKDEGLMVSLDVSKMIVPEDVDLTQKQVLKLAIIAVRKTLEGHHGPQIGALNVGITIEGTDEAKAPLKELDSKFTMEGADLSR